MKKPVKVIITLLGSLIILGAAAIFTVTTLVNPNDFKSKISAKVYQMTGRQLIFNGDIRWSFFPLGLQINQVRLNNLPASDIQPLAQIKQAAIKIKLLPLLKRRIEIEELTIDGLQWHLSKTLVVSTSAIKINGAVNLTADKQFSAQGQLKIGTLQMAKYAISNIGAHFNLQPGAAKLDIATADFYQGHCSGNFTLNHNTRLPQISAHMQFNQLQIEPLFHDLMGASRLQLAGRGDARVALTAQGNSSAALLRALNGQGQIAINNGILKGLDVPYIINTGKALLNKQPPPAASSNQTSFGKLSATFAIKNGIINNQDLLLRAPSLQATGKGNIDLNKQYIDYELVAQAAHPDSGKPDGFAIPIKISGAFAQLTVRPDLNALLQAQIQQQLDRQKDKIKDRLNIEIGKHLDKAIGDQLKQQLDSLFN
jgi:uncharacterized protein involved in outer membrane biogenesis